MQDEATILPRPGPATMTDRARGLGAVLGLAVGDAVGTTHEFDQLDGPDYPALATGPQTELVGGGPFDLAPGCVTDDSQMAAALAASLAAHGRLEVDDVAARYVAWMAHAFDVGNQTHAALARIARGVPAARAGLEVWRAASPTWRPAGNGSLMRCAPLGWAYAAAAETTLIDAALAESAITHADPRCALACAVFTSALAAAARGEVALGAGAGLVRVMRRALDVAADRLAAAWAAAGADADERAAVASGARDVAADLGAGEADTPGLYDRPGELHLDDTAGFVRVALRMACWHAVHTASWRAAVLDASNRGGDADTNAAIVGALLGARDGVNAIPEAWRAQVLAATQPGPAAWAEAHHPRRLVALVEGATGR
ncbi:MAG: ADP-ribosylglycohydrolase family protein [Kofleriaceae bacterium]|nr:ADP-ribosylglycohydrolase family protein [Kofleriaceae bacterium]